MPESQLSTSALTLQTKSIAEAGVSIRALSVADTQEFGILRIITDKPDDVRDLLKNEGYTVTATAVLAVHFDDTPGSMASILGILSDNDISVEYTYVFVSHLSNGAYMIFRVDDNDKATKALVNAGIEVLNQGDIFKRN